MSYTDTKETILKGEAQDQSALYGLIAKLRDLDLPLIAVNLIDGTNHAV